MSFRFEDLQVWQKALDLTDEINLLTKNNFPKDELFILTTQIKKNTLEPKNYYGPSTIDYGQFLLPRRMGKTYCYLVKLAA